MISEEVCRLLIEANYELPESLANRIKNCETTESDPLAKSLLSKLSENMDAAKKINVPVCQDTGMAVIFLEIGQEVALEGEPLEEAVNRGTAEAYDKGYLRKSVVGDPLFDRINTGDNTPAILHTRIVPGDRVRIVAAPKGFGSENMSAVKMFTPSATKEDISAFVVETCPKSGLGTIVRRLWWVSGSAEILNMRHILPKKRWHAILLHPIRMHAMQRLKKKCLKR